MSKFLLQIIYTPVGTVLIKESFAYEPLIFAARISGNVFSEFDHCYAIEHVIRFTQQASQKRPFLEPFIDRSKTSRFDLSNRPKTHPEIKVSKLAPFLAFGT